MLISGTFPYWLDAGPQSLSINACEFGMSPMRCVNLSDISLARMLIDVAFTTDAPTAEVTPSPCIAPLQFPDHPHPDRKHPLTGRAHILAGQQCPAFLFAPGTALHI